ncbi:MAG: alpha amylase C-terminal domain-containing protein [Lentisphaerae bacterium]|nr:alpha amylase C-terminal domain-containing protein [Lentisphaerota bacterium]
MTMLPPKRRTAKLADDPYLDPYRPVLHRRAVQTRALAERLTGGHMALQDFASAHEYYGLHLTPDGWLFREWAPNADAIYLIGERTGWAKSEAYRLRRLDNHGRWELRLPPGALAHGDLFRLRMHWPGGEGDRLPAYARRVVQDPHTLIFNAQVWAPPKPYEWQHSSYHRPPGAALIYESHVGMAQERGGVGTYDEFRLHVLPRIVAAGYNAVQFMAIAEHPYYGSFGYQVANFFAPSSRFGTPDELKHLVDAAHGCGLAVIMDLVHSHAAANAVEGLACFDGTPYQYFHHGARGLHPAWGSCCFDYGKIDVLHFLLSNCRYWLDEFHVDGFRFDGVTSMLYLHHGLGPAFTSYDAYFDGSVDEDAVAYLALANRVIHAVRPDAITIAEDVSGMPGLAAAEEEDGCGFDYRLAMGIPDMWFKLMREMPDESWHMDYLWHELTNRRRDEQTISYAESHDQALVGGKTIIFQLADAAMYDAMAVSIPNLQVERAVALHKMIRLTTLLTAGHGYLNFMGNEFGHPEWIDFPREGNGWSYHYARRQWHLRDDPTLRYHGLGEFDRAMVHLQRERGALDAGEPQLLYTRNDHKLVAFARGDLVVIANFHPSESVADYGIDLPAGTYQLELDTDEGRFGGLGRLAARQRFETQAIGTREAPRTGIRVYVPCRVALVLSRLPS